MREVKSSGATLTSSCSSTSIRSSLTPLPSGFNVVSMVYSTHPVDHVARPKMARTLQARFVISWDMALLPFHQLKSATNSAVGTVVS